MESKRKMIPTSSVSADIFGANESPPSTAGTTFTSIFPPPQTVVGRKVNTESAGSWPKQSSGEQSSGDQAWNNSKRGNMPSRDGQEERGEPCHLSSSLYYGGQEVYSQTQSTQKPGSYPIYKKDGEKDDPNGASRGNWWQGSLYY